MPHALTRVRRRALKAGHKLLFRLRKAPSRHALVGAPALAGMKRRFQFRFLTSQGLRPEHMMLDIGCGTLRGGIAFIEYLEPGHYTGVESRPLVLEEGRKELAEAGLEHKRPNLIRAAHPSEVRLTAPVDFAWAFSVLFHMPDEIVQAYFSFLAEALAPAGALYANVMFGDAPPRKWSGFPVLERRREVYEGWAECCGLRIEDLGTPESLGHPPGMPGVEMMMVRLSR